MSEKIDNKIYSVDNTIIGNDKKAVFDIGEALVYTAIAEINKTHITATLEAICNNVNDKIALVNISADIITEQTKFDNTYNSDYNTTEHAIKLLLAKLIINDVVTYDSVTKIYNTYE